MWGWGKQKKDGSQHDADFVMVEERVVPRENDGGTDGDYYFRYLCSGSLSRTSILSALSSVAAKMQIRKSALATSSGGHPQTPPPWHVDDLVVMLSADCANRADEVAEALNEFVDRCRKEGLTGGDRPTFKIVTGAIFGPDKNGGKRDFEVEVRVNV